MLRSKTRAPRVSGLSRERLGATLDRLWDHKLGLVIAPAGSGKTTLLSHFADATDVAVGWYRAEPADASAAAAVAHLEHALVGALDGLTGGWTDIDGAIAALDAWAGPRALLVIDDLHALWGTEAEGVLERLLDHLPTCLTVLAATRRLPGFDLSRMRVSGDLLEVTADDLRFRSWEVERLFHDVYGERVPPTELAELARRTEGWAAGLQLFHLATSGKPAVERRRVLRELGMRSRLVREYLTRNVLDELPVHLRDFLLSTCVLGRLTPPLCDALLGQTASEQILAELERRQIFTAAVDDEGAYRYHEVLRSHLEGVLVDLVGEAEAKSRYRRAGELHEEAADLPEALRAYCRAQDWVAAVRLLGGHGEEVIDRRGEWIDALPAALLDQDPWLLLTSARRYASQGNWEAALEAWRRAETGLVSSPVGDTCRRERQVLAAWLEPDVAVTPTEWTGALRQAVRRDPRQATRDGAKNWAPGSAVGLLTAGLGDLLAGNVTDAAVALSLAAEADDASEVVAAGAAIGAAVARSMAGEPSAVDLDRLSERADAAGVPWLAGLARCALGLEVASGVSPALVDQARAGKEDPWARALADIFLAVGRLRAGDSSVELDEAAGWCTQVEASVLTSWIEAINALALARRTGAAAAAAARLAAGRARSMVVPGALAIAHAALVLAEPERRAEHEQTASALGRETGLDLQGILVARSTTVVVNEVSCFGSFRIALGGTAVDLTGLKPRVRTLLRLLAMHGGHPIHREVLIDQLWPDEHDAKAGTRNLQSAISALRQALEPGVARGEAAVVVREGDNYRLALGPGGRIDVVDFAAAIDEGRSARRADDRARAESAFARALDCYAGPLLTEEGSAEWVVAERERMRLDAADAALALAELALDGGRPAAAVGAAERGLRIDEFRDALWRALIRGHEATGDRAAAARATRQYEEMLENLGVN